MAGKIEVTSENFGELLIQGLEEAVAIEEGGAEPARLRRVDLTARKAHVAPPPRYGAKRIVGIRRQLQVSQPVFASMLNVSPGTVRAWEQGAREPEGPTRRLLELAEKHPEVIAEGLEVRGRSRSRTAAGNARGRARKSRLSRPERDSSPGLHSPSGKP